jgi:hypothetical protein
MFSLLVVGFLCFPLLLVLLSVFSFLVMPPPFGLPFFLVVPFPVLLVLPLGAFPPVVLVLGLSLVGFLLLEISDSVVLRGVVFLPLVVEVFRLVCRVALVKFLFIIFIFGVVVLLRDLLHFFVEVIVESVQGLLGLV